MNPAEINFWSERSRTSAASSASPPPTAWPEAQGGAPPTGSADSPAVGPRAAWAPADGGVAGSPLPPGAGFPAAQWPPADPGAPSPPRSALGHLVLGSLLLVAAGTLLASPAVNLFSRRVEARADLHALDLTRDPQTAIASQVRLATNNLSDLDPPWWVYGIFASHPTAPQRIAAARAWQAP